VTRPRRLATATAVTAVLAVAAAPLVPGALADPTAEGPVRPGPVDLVELPIAADRVTGETVALRVEARLGHRDGPTPNTTVRFRAVDADSGLVTATETVGVGTLRGDRERPVETILTVPREGGYRIEAVAFADGERVAAGSRTVRGLAALQPPYARSTVGFAERGAVPPLSVSVAATDGDRTTLTLGAALTNTGDDPVSDLRVRFLVRQAESNLVAADRTVAAGGLRPGRTGEATASVTVPGSYNYRIDALVVRDGVVIDATQGVANLDPRRTISAENRTEPVDLDASEFTPGDDRRRPRATEGTPVAGGASAPGLGVGAALAALALAALGLARRTGGERR
jgi:hypothetical protein